jgi:hypothetical protein
LARQTPLTLDFFYIADLPCETATTFRSNLELPLYSLRLSFFVPTTAKLIRLRIFNSEIFSYGVQFKNKLLSVLSARFKSSGDLIVNGKLCKQTLNTIIVQVVHIVLDDCFFSSTSPLSRERKIQAQQTALTRTRFDDNASQL